MKTGEAKDCPLRDPLARSAKHSAATAARTSNLVSTLYGVTARGRVAAAVGLRGIPRAPEALYLGVSWVYQRRNKRVEMHQTMVRRPLQGCQSERWIERLRSLGPFDWKTHRRICWFMA